MNKKRIYLDYNATTPPAHFLKDKLGEWVDQWGNPSSVHYEGQAARALLWQAKEHLAHFIGCHPLELVMTSGGTEANNMAIKGLYEKYHSKHPSKTEIITSVVEHPSLREAIKYLETKGMQVRYVPISNKGELDKNFYHSVLSDKTFLVAIMHANNETGHIFPIANLAKAARQVGAIFHSDMVQTLGKMPIHLHQLGVDTASFSAHKFYALKGTGALYCRKGIVPNNLIHGGPQERKRRSGTENVLRIACMGAVAERGNAILKKFQSLKALRDQMEQQILTKLAKAQIIGQKANRLYNTSAIYIPQIDAETIMMNMDLKGYSFSVGSACHSGSLHPNETIMAMGINSTSARSVFRISLGIYTTKAEINSFVQDLQKSMDRLSAMQKQ